MAILHSDLDWSVAPHPLKRDVENKNSEVGKQKSKFVTGLEGDEPQHQEKPEPEVHLISAQWKEGPKGFEYNEQCFLEVKAQYLKKTIRARIQGKLFGIYEGEEKDLGQTVEGFIEDNGIAMMDIKHLWFINNNHGYAWRENKNIPAEYKIKGIFHSRGENEIDSPMLKMPVRRVFFTLQDDSKNVLSGIEVTFSDGSSLKTDESGEVFVNLAEGVDSIDIVKIDFPSTDSAPTL